ncbi:MAG: ATP-binding protein [Proteobacteria bacterium]|nr:ATP-binding protein [Pseudomonadota bacterium]
MEISKNDLIAILFRFNPWWKGEVIKDLSKWKRAIFNELFRWTYSAPVHRAVFLSGARQVGKTTLIRQTIQKLLKQNIPPNNILYATFDHPMIKLVGIDKIIEVWFEIEPPSGPIYLFIDEIQFMQDWQVWVKHQIDFNKDRKIIFTGSAVPLVHKGQESGVGRWHTIPIATLSFYEYLSFKKSYEQTFIINELGFSDLSEQEFYDWLKSRVSSQPLAKPVLYLMKEKFQELISIKNILENIPDIDSLKTLFDEKIEFQKLSQLTALIGLFNQYLIKGGFPQTVPLDILEAQSLIREDTVDKVLKRDLTAFFGVRKFIELEQVFLYLCMNDRGILNLEDLASNLNISRTTALNFIELLEATHLIYRLQKFGYGKDVLRARFKVYLADPAIAPSVLLMGKSILTKPDSMGKIVETAIFKHLFLYSEPGSKINYWKDQKNHEVDLVISYGEHIIPFEIKYRNQHNKTKDLSGLMKLCNKYHVKHGYIVTQSMSDFGTFKNHDLPETEFIKIPAALLCYWLGKFESEKSNHKELQLF